MEFVRLPLCFLMVLLLRFASATQETRPGSVLPPTVTRDRWAEPRTEGRHCSKLPIILGVIGAALVVLLGLCYCRWKLQIKCPFKEMLVHQYYNVMFNYKCTFKYHFLQTSTSNFEDGNKLGQGAFGSVYKGVLPDGREIAVKRLFFNTRQGIDDFYNEVNLLSSVRHKNLVKLVGCSAEGPERLLVYEYLPNNSLDKFLFGKNNNSKLLDWRRKFKIIVGTAEGLAYLHEESEICIIHRDIKASNILLDQNLNPKIADFGLARFFTEDQRHIFRGVAGTLGYIAPEYALDGQLTEKVDVFSFGVLVLEIVSGRKNSNSTATEEPQFLLQTIWRHYESKTLIPDIIDPNLEDKEEALRVVHVALLCAQAAAKLRPPMSEVVQMLTSNNPNLPLPTEPAFTNSTNAYGKPNQTFASNSVVSSNDITINVLEPR